MRHLDVDTMLRVERLAYAAWPAASVEVVDGWSLRYTPGVLRRRSNSALPPPSPGPVEIVELALDRVEAFYAELRQPVIVQVSPAELHPELDSLLAARGYVLGGATAVLTAPAEQVMSRTKSVPQVTVTLAERLTPEWRATWTALDAHQDTGSTADQVLPRIAGWTGYALAALDRRPVGVGLFVAAAGWSGVFCMATHPRARRRGVATAILHAGARWAAGRGAHSLYLSVEDDNTAAQALYADAGFERSHGYHFRSATAPGIQSLS